MNKTIAGWLAVIGAGATAAGGIIIAAPLDKRTAIIAVLTFVASAGAAARALYTPTPAKSPPAE